MKLKKESFGNQNASEDYCHKRVFRAEDIGKITRIISL
jgi:hypothetical protein